MCSQTNARQVCEIGLARSQTNALQISQGAINADIVYRLNTKIQQRDVVVKDLVPDLSDGVSPPYRSALQGGFSDSGNANSCSPYRLS